MHRGRQRSDPSISAFVVGPGAWHQVAAVYDSKAAVLSLHVDGFPDARDVLAIAGNGKLGAGRIGGRLGPPDSWFHGRIDDVRVYSRALSDVEISAVYHATR